MDDVLAAIDAALERKGLSDAAASKLAVGNPSLIKNLRNRTTDRKRAHLIDNLKSLADVLGLEFYIGPPRQPTESMLSNHERIALTLVPRYDVDAAAGDGASVGPVGQDESLVFRRDWLSKQGISARSAALLRAKGDSMEPIIWDGDTLLIDTSRTVPVARPKGRLFRKGYQEDVYVIERDGDLRVKAVRRPDKETLIMVSENTRLYDPEVLKGNEINEIRVVGQVMWWGHVAA